MHGCGRRFPRMVLLAAMLGLAQAALVAQEDTESAAIPSAKSLEDKLAEIKANEELEAGLKAALLESNQSSLREVNRIAEAKKNASQFKQDAETAAERAEKLRSELEEATWELNRVENNPDAFSLSGKSSIEELEALQSTRMAELAALKQELQEIEARQQQRTSRRTEIEQQQIDAETRRAELQQQINAPPPAGMPPELTEAKAQEAMLRLEAFRETQTANGFELAKYSAEDAVGLHQKTADLLKKRIAIEEKHVAAIADRVRKLREQEASTLEREITSQSNDIGQKHPLREFANENVAYVNELQQDLTGIESAERQTQQIAKRLERQEEELEDIQGKEEQVGLTRPIGLLLREQRGELPDLRERERQIDARLELIEAEMNQSWEYERELDALPTAAELVERAETSASEAAGRPVEFPEPQREAYLETAADLLQTREKLLTELKQRSREHLEALTDLDSIDQQHVQHTRTYLDYINERILWIRSDEPLTPAVVMAETGTWTWLADTSNWWGILATLAADASEYSFGFWPVLFVVVALGFLRIRFRKHIRELGEQANKRGFLDYAPTARAALLTLVSASTIPLMLSFLSWRLLTYPSPDVFRLAVGEALAVSAAILFPIEVLREVCRQRGLAEAHFNWPPRAVAHLRRGIWWLKVLGIPLTFLVVMAHFHDPRAASTAPERILFVLFMVLMAIVLHRLLIADGQLVKSLKVENPQGIFSRFQRLWHVMGVGIPLALAGFSIAGFHYTSGQIASRMMWTIWLVAAVMVLRSLAVRWIVLSRRRLLLKQAQQRRTSAAEEEEPGAVPKPPAPIEETDVSKSTAQTRRLLDIFMWGVALVGLWFVWNATFPALRVLDQPIRSTFSDEETAAAPIVRTEQSDAAPAAADGAEGTGDEADPVEEASGPDPIVGLTWLNLGTAILVALFTFVASRNLPGLMEMSVLNRLPVENATRYAATRLTSYAIVTVGVLLTANSIGLKWQNVQWLAAALTVGLGFGLQEVFANFVSGLILLFERPIRVGDIVTIEGVTGVVSKIRMRATTVINWERQELVVPNKDLITGRLLNWTLTNSTRRFAMNVGVGHNSDTDLARELMLRACAENPSILADPPPTATFDGFGESRFTLTLRCYLDGMDQWFDVTHDLHTKIARLFREAGIQFAFPQRDLHIRSFPPEWNPAGRRVEFAPASESEENGKGGG